MASKREKIDYAVKRVRNAKRRNFPHAPPKFPGDPEYPRRPNPPYPDAPLWKCSVYYFWWEYLRRHEGYRRKVEDPNRKRYSQVYEDFGDVFSTDFPSWWDKKSYLFTFQDDFEIALLSMPAKPEDQRYFVTSVPVLGSEAKMVRYFREELRQKAELGSMDFKRNSRRAIKYVPAQRPVLKSLHEHLLVWDARQENPEMPFDRLLDIAGLEVWDDRAFQTTIAEKNARGEDVTYEERTLKRKKKLLAQRHYRIASEYIKYVALGEFPKRDRR